MDNEKPKAIISVMFTNNMAIQGVEIDNYYVYDEWIRAKIGHETIMINKNNVAYFSVRYKTEQDEDTDRSWMRGSCEIFKADKT